MKAVNLVLSMALMCLLSAGASARASDAPIQVVTSFSVLKDWVSEIGGARVEVYSLVGPDEDVHVFSASPRDLSRVSQADALIVNGLGLEGWINRLTRSSSFKGALVVASEGIEPIYTDLRALQRKNLPHSHSHSHTKAHDHNSGQVDPHAWLSLNMAEVYVQNIAEGLSRIAPSYRQEFEQRKQDYLKRLKNLEQNLAVSFASIAPERRQVVVPHNSFAYFARDYQLRFHSLKGINTSSEASAASFATIVRTVKRQKIYAIFGENIANDRLISRVAREADLVLGGKLISGALSPSNAPTYLKMMEHNASLILKALEKRK